MTADLLADYRRRGWSLVPIQAGEKGPRIKDWDSRSFTPADYREGQNVGVILGPRSGELVDVDLDCPEALALADLYLPASGAEFGRASKPCSHRLFVAPGAAYEAFSDPLDGTMLLELRAQGRDGGAHQTLWPPSVADGERREWHGDTIAPAVVDAGRLRRRCAWLATACLVARHVSRHAAERPSPDLPLLLWEADHDLGRKALGWFGLAPPDAPRQHPKRHSDLTADEIDLAELVHEIPNTESWEGWNAVGMAIYASSNGSDQGGVIFDDWSAKSPKYDPRTTEARWRHYSRSKPTKTGAGKLIKAALAAGWRPARAAS